MDCRGEVVKRELELKELQIELEAQAQTCQEHKRVAEQEIENQLHERIKRQKLEHDVQVESPPLNNFSYLFLSGLWKFEAAFEIWNH